MYSLSLKATDDVHYLWLLWMDTTSPRFPAISPRKPWVLKFQPPCGRGRSFQRRSQPWHAHIAPPWMSTLFILTFEQHIYKNCTTLHLCFCCCCCQSQTKNLWKLIGHTAGSFHTSGRSLSHNPVAVGSTPAVGKSRYDMKFHTRKLFTGVEPFWHHIW